MTNEQIIEKYGYLLKPINGKKKAHPRLPNGFGSISVLSGKRRRPYWARLPVTEWTDKGHPIYNTVDYFSDWMEAFIVLARLYDERMGNAVSVYSNDPRSKLKFREVYEEFYEAKFKISPNTKHKRTSTEVCMGAAFKHCEALHEKVYASITTLEMEKAINQKGISHSTAEHIKNLLSQMGKYALKYQITKDNRAQNMKLEIEDDTEPGVPFTSAELNLLWKNKDRPFVDTILIYCYSGWRINELARMPLKDIDLFNRTFTGGLKNKYSRNRTIPIHPKIIDMVISRYNLNFKSLIYHDGVKDISESDYRKYFNQALLECGITEQHTPHDCRHTCNTLLDNAEVNRVARYKIMGHAGKDINEKVYAHKDINQLKKAMSMI